jgi:dGTPase
VSSGEKGWTVYDEEAWERFVDEPPKRSGRTPFERDRARVVHSSALRRLAAKTQVYGAGANDFVRNRLTHSLEVAQVGRELGKTLGCDPDIVDTACLAHDLGHPPFGHNGERALDELAGPIDGFEGNAQTLRLLTRLEAKTVDADGRSAGLNLTRATLDAATKYPYPRGEAPAAHMPVDPAEPGPRQSAQAVGDDAGPSLISENPPPKYGVYAEDRAVFDWLRAGSPEGRPCIEAQVMDWCDDVAYSVHDLEDGVQIGAIDLKLLHLPAARVEVFATTRALYAPGVPDDEIGAALDRLLDRSWWPQSYDGSRRDLAVLKNLTSHLVGRFCSTAEAATRREYGPGPLTRHSADLIVPRPTRLEVAVLKGIAAHYVMFIEERRPRLDEERALLTELVEAIVAGAPATLEPPFQADWAEAADDKARLRVAVDQVASLTDVSAREWHRRLGR